MSRRKTRTMSRQNKSKPINPIRFTLQPKLVCQPSNLTFRWIRFPRWVGVMCPDPTEPALDTLFRSVDHACWES